MSAGALSYRQPLVLPACGKHSATLIMLHGLGDQGEGLGEFVYDLAGELRHVKKIFPHAPSRPSTVNGGTIMVYVPDATNMNHSQQPGWYDIHSLDDLRHEEDAQGLMASKRYIEGLVQQEVAAGIQSDRVVVWGLSQGGAMALLMLRSDIKLAGVVGLSTYLPLGKQPPIISEANKNTPVLLCHGDADTTIRFHYGVEAHKQLQAAGAAVGFRLYDNKGHWLFEEELDAVQAFLKKVLP